MYNKPKHNYYESWEVQKITLPTSKNERLEKPADSVTEFCMMLFDVFR
jgi:hypothetical protein